MKTTVNLFGLTCIIYCFNNAKCENVNTEKEYNITVLGLDVAPSNVCLMKGTSGDVILFLSFMIFVFTIVVYKLAKIIFGGNNVEKVKVE